MRILLDLHHAADVNFFKEAVAISRKDYGCEFEVMIQPRGRLVPIFEREFGDMPFTTIGRHRGSFSGKMFGTAARCASMLWHLRKRDFDIATAFGGVGLCHVTSSLMKPSVIFDDDIEYKLGFSPYRPFATRIVLPQSLPIEGGNIVKYKGFKELAYLHPNYFKPDVKSLREHGVAERQYVFVREVSSSTLNYRDLKMGQLADVCSHLKDLGLDVVLSLEDKSFRSEFEKQCIILNEPVNDIYSLLHYALFTISSGDTMARESCLVGTPTIYTGGRKMSVNRELIVKGVLFEESETQPILASADKIIKEDLKHRTGTTIQTALAEEWEDTTQVIIRNWMAFLDNSPPKSSGKAVTRE